MNLYWLYLEKIKHFLGFVYYYRRNEKLLLDNCKSVLGQEFQEFRVLVALPVCNRKSNP